MSLIEIEIPYVVRELMGVLKWNINGRPAADPWAGEGPVRSASDSVVGIRILRGVNRFKEFLE